MTLEEAAKIGAVIETADGGCGPCVTALAELMEAAFPEFSWEVVKEDYQYGVRVSLAKVNK